MTNYHGNNLLKDYKKYIRTKNDLLTLLGRSDFSMPYGDSIRFNNLLNDIFDFCKEAFENTGAVSAYLSDKNDLVGTPEQGALDDSTVSSEDSHASSLASQMSSKAHSSVSSAEIPPMSRTDIDYFGMNDSAYYDKRSSEVASWDASQAKTDPSAMGIASANNPSVAASINDTAESSSSSIPDSNTDENSADETFTSSSAPDVGIGDTDTDRYISPSAMPSVSSDSIKSLRSNINKNIDAMGSDTGTSNAFSPQASSKSDYHDPANRNVTPKAHAHNYDYARAILNLADTETGQQALIATEPGSTYDGNCKRLAKLTKLDTIVLNSLSSRVSHFVDAYENSDISATDRVNAARNINSAPDYNKFKEVFKAQNHLDDLSNNTNNK